MHGFRRGSGKASWIARHKAAQSAVSLFVMMQSQLKLAFEMQMNELLSNFYQADSFLSRWTFWFGIDSGVFFLHQRWYDANLAVGFLIVSAGSRGGDGGDAPGVGRRCFQTAGAYARRGERQSVIKILFSMTTPFHASFFTHRRNTQSAPWTQWVNNKPTLTVIRGMQMSRGAWNRTGPSLQFTDTHTFTRTTVCLQYMCACFTVFTVL